MNSSVLIQEYFDNITQLYPSLMANLGIKNNKENIYENPLSKQHILVLDQTMKKYKRKLENVTNKDSIDYKLLKYVITDYFNSKKYSLDDYMPLDSFYNTIIYFTFFNHSSYIYKTAKDINNLISRHMCFIEYINDMILFMKKGMKKNILIAKLTCSRIIEDLYQFIKNKSYIVKINKSTNNTLLDYNKYVEFANNKYLPVIQKLLNFLENIYLPKCFDTIGLCRLGNRGKDMYRYLIKQYTTIDITPEYIYRTGLSEVKRINKQIQYIKEQLGYDSTISNPVFFNTMISDPNYFYKTKKEVIDAFVNKRTEIINTVIPKYFNKQLKTYNIKPVPKDLESSSAGAFFEPGSFYGRRKGCFYINTRDVKENPIYTVTVLSLHEGFGGHAYMFQYFKEKKIPIYRTTLLESCAFVEGYALYAESLYDYNNKPLDMFGKLTFELFRSVRLVVDVGIHYYGWNFNKALKYMMRHLALSKTEIITEIERYISIPGQAVCYKIGELTIQKLRQVYLNNGGNLKDFHDLLLEDGLITLEILQEKIKIK